MITSHQLTLCYAMDIFFVLYSRPRNTCTCNTVTQTVTLFHTLSLSAQFYNLFLTFIICSTLLVISMILHFSQCLKFAPHFDNFLNIFVQFAPHFYNLILTLTI